MSAGEVVDEIVGEAKSLLGMWAKLPETKEARLCECVVDEGLRVRQTKDPKHQPLFSQWVAKMEDGYVKTEFDKTGEHYGWMLGAALEKGLEERNDRFAQELDVCLDPLENQTHRNTIAAQPWELIKLDCGYWGTFYRDRKVKDLNQSRDFGMILGHDVWLCRFHGDVSDDALREQLQKQIDDLPPDGAAGKSRVRKFMQACFKRGLAVQLVSHTTAPSTELTKGLDDRELKILFPDLHLPERWPDEPSLEGGHRALHPDPAARVALQWRLIAMQHAPGRLWGNPLSDDDQAELQKHIERFITTQDGDAVAEIGGFTFKRNEFLAELAYVERRIRAGSAWFYGLEEHYAPINSTRSALTNTAKTGLVAKLLGAGSGAAMLAVALGGMASYLQGNHYVNSVATAPSTPEPSAAIDLVRMLFAMLELKEECNISVYQLGDLFELWMGREFLYFDFPTTDKPLSGDADKALSISKYFVLDKYQNRSDAGWNNKSEPTAEGVKRFSFDPIDTDRLKERFKTGGATLHAKSTPERTLLAEIGRTWLENRDRQCKSVPEDQLVEIGEKVRSRLSTLLHRRVENVLAFSGPLTEKAEKSHAWGSRTDEEKAYFEKHKRDAKPDPESGEWGWSAPFREARKEYYWNLAILELLRRLGCHYIHGNHDGYRSDPLLRSPYASNEVISMPGVWLEHVHRFDDFNRDGRSFGAGVTNLVYYFNEDLLFLDKAKEKLPGRLYQGAEHTANIPGAAQWFLVANLADLRKKIASTPGAVAKDPLPRRGADEDDVRPFAIFACGHTHTPDLVRVQFVHKTGQSQPAPSSPSPIFSPAPPLA